MNCTCGTPIIPAWFVPNQNACLRCHLPIANPPPVRKPLEPGYYVATGSDQTLAGEPFYFRVIDHPTEGPVVWGFSIFRRVRGYRTLGRQLEDWLARPANANMIIRPDCDRVQHKLPLTVAWATSPPPPVSDNGGCGERMSDKELLAVLDSKPVVFRVPWCACYKSGDILHYDEASQRYCCPTCGEKAMSGREARAEMLRLRATLKVVRAEAERLRDNGAESGRRFLAILDRDGGQA